MIPPSLRSASSALRTITRPSIRTRRLFTSSFFLATFCGAIVTVSLTTILPCPARVGPGQYRSRENRRASEEASASAAATDSLRQGERIHLTKKGGWIEIDKGITGSAA
ncbi:uncharacterized protein FA14DRAFT_7492 [Meira miltonrushii]|uniref:Uncharacterized protein n=1 Tax=Meira miltonrushii TaxID=1280837 RepID=A0A316VMS9_9BASI|nr:uncharacterized protein FA14DRAFT_7492 [Meira miltonrushii]PWN36865.1 hypothetical protein FA14DRAFT_7492 [Meira miltonrushii]